MKARGWEQTNFVELWLVSRPRLAEMAIEIWVTSGFESLCRYSEIQGISEHLRE